MSLASRIAARTRQPSVSLWLNGRRARGILTAQTDSDLGGNITSGRVTLRNPPVTPTPGMAVRWTWGYDGYEAPGFTGYVVDPKQTSYPGVWELACQDVLWYAARYQGDIATDPLNSIGAKAAIEYILQNYAGLNRLSIPTISLGGGTWTLGQLTPVSWDRSTALAAAAEIAATAGYWLYADAGGTVRARQVERRPSSSPFRTFTRGVDLLVEGAPERRRPGDQVRNRITVRGANTGVEGAQLVEQYLAPHAVYPGVVSDLEYSSTLLEYIADCTAVAERLAALWNRSPNIVTARIKADPRLSVGTTVAIRDSGIGYGSAQTFFIYSLTTTFDGRRGRFDQQLTLDGGVGDGGYTTIPAPEAVIAYTVETETIDGTACAIIRCDGSGSYSLSEGEIVSWQWSTSDTPYSGTASGSSSPHASPLCTFIIPASEAPFSISLTVTDTTSKTGTATAEIALTGDVVTPTTEAVHTAAGSAWSATPDGGATWRDEVRTTTIVAESAGVRDDAPLTDAAAYGALATSSADVRQTLDVLASTSTLLNSASGTITALHTNARNGARVWRAIGTTVQRSLDGGTTWATMGTAPASVRQIIEDPALDNSIFVLAGANVYNSTDGGAGGFATLYAGPSGATARWMERSDDGAVTWVCYTGTFAGSPLQRIEGGISVTFPVVSPVVSEIRAIALTKEPQPRIVAVDQEGRTWWADGLTGLSVTQGPSLPAGGVAQHATASREAPDIVYLADFDSVTASTTGALRKLVLNNGDGVLLPWRLGPAGRQYHMVALAVAATGMSYELLAITYGDSPGGVYHWTRASGWTLKNSGLPSGFYWYGIHVNPFNPSEWLLLGDSSVGAAITTKNIVSNVVKAKNNTTSPLWYTNDAGATWTAVSLGGVTGLTNIGINDFDVSWSEDVPGWRILGNWSASTTSRLWRGTGSTAGSPATFAKTLYLALPGQDGDVVCYNLTDSAWNYIDSSDTRHVPSGSWSGGAASGATRLPNTRQIAAVGTTAGGIFTTADYRSGQPATDSGLDGAARIASVGDLALASDILRLQLVRSLYSAPTVTDLATYAFGWTCIVQSWQQRASGGYLAAWTGLTTNVGVTNGVQTEWIDLPSATLQPSGGHAVAIIRKDA